MITTLLLLYFVSKSEALCGAHVRWSHHFNMEDVYGMWYGVAYAKHSPDLTDRPDEIGCVTLYINEHDEEHEDWLDMSLPRRNYSDYNWVSFRNNPWSDTRMAGSWLDIRLKRSAKQKREAAYKIKREARYKRDMDEERKVRVLWDEDGQSMEQTYVYSPEAPGLWTVQQWRPLERQLIAKGVDVWYPDDPPRHPDVIRILKVTPVVLIINHCSDLGGGGVFSLILKRSPTKINFWEWYDIEREFNTYDLPHIRRKAAVCAACLPVFSIHSFLICFVLLKIF